MKVFIFNMDYRELESEILLVKNVIEDAQVYTFEDVTEAFLYAQNHAVDLALLDTAIKGIASINLAGMLQNKNPKVKIIFCSYAEPHQDRHPHYQQFYDNAFLKKPITKEKLKKAIASMSPLPIKTLKNKNL